MNDQVVETWAFILQRVPASKLLLKSKQLDDPAQIEEVKSRFQKFDIPVERLILEGSESREAYFEAYQGVDIVLDTFPYPGGTTSVDSLWMGVPVLTLTGDRFLSHLGESIAINAGNSDWIAADVNDYVNKAVQFASYLDGLAHLRSTLRERVLRSPLFDTSRFAKNFGEALLGMWNQRDLPP
jgi:predicted O-linked N-acetylglucosamine transferase (SPINDLY family)